ncbi:hypothetical protein P886_3852 [Alteromonadaceae bacterium 2753L.S.0a.02]|nr:hypothetical protein P886_3852 [Alteromonadaceae bacterium 2753L.S.0a.02]
MVYLELFNRSPQKSKGTDRPLCNWGRYGVNRGVMSCCITHQPAEILLGEQGKQVGVKHYGAGQSNGGCGQVCKPLRQYSVLES